MGLAKVRQRTRYAGLTILELVTSLFAFGIILMVTHQILAGTTQSWRRLSGDQGASSQLQRAEGWLRRDLSLAAYAKLRVAPGPSSLTGKDGDAVWFLSAVDPDTGEFIRNPDGTPRWQRNILYYSVVPAAPNPSEFQGSGIAVDGYEAAYPYKLLVRKEIDAGSPTVASDPSSSEELIDDITPYLEQPQGLTFPSGDSQVTLAANRLLSFQVTPNDQLQSLRVTLWSAGLEEARREFAIGSRVLTDRRFLLERRFEIFPDNKVLAAP